MRLVKWLLPVLVVLALGYYWFSKEQANLIAGVVVNKFLDQLDSNADGVITEDEGFGGMFSLVDANGDSVADRAELVALIARSMKPFRWSNPPQDSTQSRVGVNHATFSSKILGEEVGYNIYLPPGYESASSASLRYPVIYYLHGGRPGNESRSVGLAESIHDILLAGSVRPFLFVWVNGGEISHYNYADSPGEDVFVQELIPHIDSTYRTMAERGGRALQGFSQGGRGATRIMFKYPELFVSAAPGGSGYAVEQQIRASGGIELDTRQSAGAVELDFGAGNDAYSLAEQYSKNPDKPNLPILIWAGEQGMNYSANLEYLDYLDGLGVSAARLFAPQVDHNPFLFYQARGSELLEFHDRYWIETTHSIE